MNSCFLSPKPLYRLPLASPVASMRSAIDAKSFEIMTIDIHKIVNGQIVEVHHLEDWPTPSGNGALSEIDHDEHERRISPRGTGPWGMSHDCSASVSERWRRGRSNVPLAWLEERPQGLPPRRR